jgi:REP element-mobilizing transposase RayT
MPSPWTELYLHLAWATWQRRPLLTPEVQPQAYRLILYECGRLKAELMAIGGLEDHVHLLLKVPTTLAPATLAQQAKGATSHALNRPGSPFRWQEGYGAFSLSKRHVSAIESYVHRQPEHHAKGEVYKLLEPPLWR